MATNDEGSSILPEASASPSDLQSLFEAQAGRNDFLTASKVDDVFGLCLSGGGYRAMLYHAGALVRLNEMRLLPKIQEVASVSGGSITAGILALAWPRLRFDVNAYAENFADEVVAPIARFATVALDIRAALLGLLPWSSAAEEIAKGYDRELFRGATLLDLPDRPRFTFMATNLQTGSGWRFAKDYAADHRVGRINQPDLPLSRVIAASSAFPPFLSPLRLKFGPNTVKPMASADLHKPPYTEHAVLTDGGVYDNMGLERVWRRCRTILVSNAGRTIPQIGSPTGRWMGQLYRTLSIIHQQAENSRKRILFGLNNLKQRRVAFWSIDTPIEAYGLADALPISSADCSKAANIRTRLNPFSKSEIDLLLHVGYAGADASIRARGLAPEAVPADLGVLRRTGTTG